jgi:hypothetical protein
MEIAIKKYNNLLNKAMKNFMLAYKTAKKILALIIFCTKIVSNKIKVH